MQNNKRFGVYSLEAKYNNCWCIPFLALWWAGYEQLELQTRKKKYPKDYL